MMLGKIWILSSLFGDISGDVLSRFVYVSVYLSVRNDSLKLSSTL
jgi:hypothetical protein